jgi:hypothetical protein
VFAGLYHSEVARVGLYIYNRASLIGGMFGKKGFRHLYEYDRVQI